MDDCNNQTYYVTKSIGCWMHVSWYWEAFKIVALKVQLLSSISDNYYNSNDQSKFMYNGTAVTLTIHSICDLKLTLTCVTEL